MLEEVLSPEKQNFKNYISTLVDFNSQERCQICRRQTDTDERTYFVRTGTHTA